ncbi:recombinase family protein [Streptomyces sp. NPDC127097]|uniref:recombinase family protein n=1 Tax=Streptomyces sp. NPDC127097 TaxID=3347136 RepID=UPI00365B9187
MLAGPLPGIYDPTGPGELLFEFFPAMAETERENIREPTLEGLDTAAPKGKHGGRPPVVTEDMPYSKRAVIARVASRSSHGPFCAHLGDTP